MATKQGRFDWYELMTTDVEGAKAFYTEVIGWKITKWEGAGFDYAMWSVGERSVGGVMVLPEPAKQQGAPPHWLSYIETGDVDATVDKAQALGGRIYQPGTDIPNVGRFAIIADPQGAVFAAFKPAGPMEDVPHEPGFFNWSELNTTDYEAAWKFYSELFGWKPTSAMDMGPEFGRYFMFGLDEQRSMGGMSNAATMMKAPAHWLYYVTVADLDATLEKVGEHGGKVLNGPMEVPGGDRIAQCLDPQGAAFALYASGSK